MSKDHDKSKNNTVGEKGRVMAFFREIQIYALRKTLNKEASEKPTFSNLQRREFSRIISSLNSDRERQTTSYNKFADRVHQEFRRCLSIKTTGI